MFNSFQKVIRLNTISEQEAEELAAWEFIHPHEEGEWDKLEREQEN